MLLGLALITVAVVAARPDRVAEPLEQIKSIASIDGHTSMAARRLDQVHTQLDRMAARLADIGLRIERGLEPSRGCGGGTGLIARHLERLRREQAVLKARAKLAREQYRRRYKPRAECEDNPLATGCI
jgi:hypothetical protein